MHHKLNRKLQVLLSDEEVEQINAIILNDAIKNNSRPVSISSFIRYAVREEIQRRGDDDKSWDPMDNKKLKSK